MQSSRNSRRWLLLAGTVAQLLGGYYTVNSFIDAPDADPGDGVCARALTPEEIHGCRNRPQLRSRRRHPDH
jgi:hypothetical protein